MPDLETLRRLTCEMYLFTRNGAHTRDLLDLTVSHEAVKKAPVRILSEREQAQMMDRLQRRIADEYLTSPTLEAERLREGLSHWHGVRLKGGN